MTISEALKELIVAIKGSGNEKDIKEEIRQSLKAFESVPEEKTDEKNLDALLERLMKDYHRSTGS